MVRKAHHAKVVALLVAFMFIVQAAFGSTGAVYATIYQTPTPTQTSEIRSSVGLKSEYYRVRTPLKEKYTIYVEGKTKVSTKRFCIRIKKHKTSNYVVTVFVTPNKKGEFSIKINTKKGNKTVPKVIGGKGTVVGPKKTSSALPGNKAIGTIGAGTYNLTIARATTTKDANVSKGAKWSNGTLSGSKGYAYKEFLLTVKSGDSNNLKAVKYDEVIANNDRVRATNASTSSFTSKTLDEMPFVFWNVSGQDASKSEQAAYFEEVAKSVTAGASSDYNKALKIYEYVGGNFYYDVLAFSSSSAKQYANPYCNLYNLRNNIASENSVKGSKKAKVATTCQGYSAMVIALARASGIPARLVYGHHLSQPIAIWANESKVSNRDHFWAELYVNGRWMIVDANAGTNAKWKRSSVSQSGTWEFGGLMTYAGFDPTPEVFSNSYSYNGVYNRGFNDVN